MRSATALSLVVVRAAGWDIIQAPDANRLIRINSGKAKPQNSFVAVNYRDLKTKRTFALMMMLFTLADTGEKENLPLVTIPAQ